MEVRFTQLWVIAILNINISQGSVVMHLRCGGIFNYSLFHKFAAKSVSEKKLENQLAFGKVRAKK